ncbi:MAG: LCP family protein [Eubacteriales bacterium]|nr:LCP family protein [Eubacteriales bacterium]
MKKRTKFAILASVAVVVVTLGVVVGLFASGILNDPKGAFSDGNGSPTSTAVTVSLEPGVTPNPTEAWTLEPGATETPTPSPTIDPFITLQQQADLSSMHDIVNILVIGIDGDEYRESSDWGGKKEWHSDVMLVLAVNFDQMKVDMISLPRDTYANIPGVDGIYKLNASLNCGGGYVNKDGTINYAAFEKVCQSAEWMLGGIPVDYYYAVNMDTVKALVNAVGGIDYEIEGYFDIGGRFYEPGLQHMDGQAVLDYMRVRKKSKNTVKWSISTADSNRVNRQKEMLKALLIKMKNDNLITTIPDIVQSFSGSLFTNCTLEQTASLAVFAYQLDTANITMRTMGGSSASLLAWNFVFTNQTDRVNMIKEIYGVSVGKEEKYTKQYAQYTWGTMLEDVYLELCKPLTKYVGDLIAADDLLPEFTPEPSPSPTAVPSDSPSTAPDTTAEPTLEATPEAVNPKIYTTQETPGVRKYGEEMRKLWTDYNTCLEELAELRKTADKEAKKARNGSSNSLSSVSTKYLDKLTELQDKAIALGKAFGYEKSKFYNTCYPTDNYKSNSLWALNYWDDKKINEVNVDFN